VWLAGPVPPEQAQEFPFLPIYNLHFAPRRSFTPIHQGRESSFFRSRSNNDSTIVSHSRDGEPSVYNRITPVPSLVFILFIKSELTIWVEHLLEASSAASGIAIETTTIQYIRVSYTQRGKPR